MQNCITQCFSLLSIHQHVFINLQDGVDEVFYLVSIADVFFSTTDMDGGIVQYTHHSKIHSEMKQFVAMMQVCRRLWLLPSFIPFDKYVRRSWNCLEETATCPFALAAWIHSAFSRIHPFTVSASDLIS